MRDIDLARIRRKSNFVLVAAQALTGLGAGGTITAGALLIAEVTGSPVLSGMASTTATLGGAVAAVPLAALARKAGRARALATGSLIAAGGSALMVFGAALSSIGSILIGSFLLGFGGAVGLQARFAATDISEPGSRARDLSLVVWASTVGAVLGPNLVGPADVLVSYFHLPTFSGVFVFAVIAQLLAAVLYSLGLRPDPLLLAQTLRVGAARRQAQSDAKRSLLRLGVVAVALSNVTMISVMAMTPVHLSGEGATLGFVGLTISLHIAGMYALAPVMGWLADRLGKLRMVVAGQLLFGIALAATSFGAERHDWVLVGLVFLGLGWSASTVAGSSLIVENAGENYTRTQGRADLVTGLAGAAGGALAGPLLAALGYAGLSLVALALVVSVLVALAVMSLRAAGRRQPLKRNSSN